MSSLRNAVKRITHKERSQPQNRSHLGLLEKKKDYKLRANDYHLKEEQLKAMKSKASLRNPDEFYFGMNRSAVVDGTHKKTNEARMKEMQTDIGPDAVRLMKDQDLTYVRLHRQRDVKKIDKMESEMHFLGVAGKEVGRSHTIFVDTNDEADNFNVAEHFDTVPEFANRDFNRRRVKDIIQSSEEKNTPSSASAADEMHKSDKYIEKEAKRNLEQLQLAAEERSKSYRELELRKNRLSQLSMAEAHLNTEKLMRCKGKKRKVKDSVNGMPAVYKWRKVRSG